MPRNTPGYRTMSIEVKDALADAMKALADENGRTLREEINHAFQRHTEQPPHMVTPDLAPAEAIAEPKKRPGRPRKKADG